MLPPRALVPTVLVSSVLWVGIGALGYGIGYVVPTIPGPVTALLLPVTVPSELWYGPRTQDPLVAVIAGVVHAAVLALLLRLIVRRPGVIPIWFAAILTSFVAAGILGAASLIGVPSATGLRAFAGQTIQQLTPAGLWGMMWGWVPAVIGARLGRVPSASGSPAVLIGPVVAVVAGGAAALLILPTLSRQEAIPPAAVPLPSPSITRYSWADIAVPTAQPQAANSCDSSDLRVIADEGDAATGHRALGIQATNTSGSACVLDGYADVVFDDTDRDAMDVLVTHGGSFMTTDGGAERIRLAPGDSAVAELGWNAQSAAGEQRAGTLFVSVFAGAPRLALPVDLDIKDDGAVALTAWHAPTAG